MCFDKCLCSLFLSLFCFINVCQEPVSCGFQKLTVLTKPTYEGHATWEHAAVMRSLMQGIKILQVPYNYNPSSIDGFGDVVLVVCNPRALKQAVDLKKQGLIKKLFVGPNFFPQDVNYPEIDVYFVPSAWVITFALYDCPGIVSRCRVWYAGIDKDFWQPLSSSANSSKNVLVYWKTESVSFCEQVEKTLKEHGWNPKRLKYGSYKPEQYKKMLQDCRFAVFISATESQGLALAECWAMDVPTLPWNPKTAVILEKNCNFVSSCPYLTPQTGFDWQNLEELKALLRSIDRQLSLCSPRKWVLDNMTDEISVAKLIGIINDSLK